MDDLYAMGIFIVPPLTPPPTPPPDFPEDLQDQELTEPSVTISKNGRLYDLELYEDQYPWPIDSEARERQQHVHDVLIAYFGGSLWHAPITSQLGLVLDIGTGTGCWAFHFADELTSVRVHAIDSVVLQTNLVPLNLEIDIDNVSKYSDWHTMYQDVDFAHIGRMGHRIQNLGNVVNGIARCGKPGAWAEFVDWIVEFQTDQNCPVRQWCKDMKDALSHYGYDLDLPLEYENTLKEKGFSSVKTIDHRIPLSLEDSRHTMTSKKVVQIWAESLVEFSLEPMTAKLGYSAEYVHALCSAVYLTIVNGHTDGYLNWRVVYGQIPRYDNQQVLRAWKNFFGCF
ncbi:hypothetical protein ASPWEDRAFT_177873 [Aspergillus wentii DTO 134E9]|uniref:Methyltransferase domain-containing protein n=1 Tax=Aspergillus wentii DTO 134E9 TaxID=1073089 RepID=A0A1L9R3V8_ASPWE|nr:uncharacterized protein ASPWEDRAFT_177873 [Aspergillus wentii DTO 134E9]KAI9923412.1 hypothetical protein MW887_009342 [Aspergillus wentii]OJJ29567.1 hypothetical protein ASPWEDRAFT_177873 [Aspergillus wentii DTO 134E9]